MIRLRRSEDRGHVDHGWLRTYHTFSFASYQDPEFTRFGPLRVINQDFVAPGRGFATHGHENMEIVTYVYDGVLEHEDSMGNGSRIRPGEVQLMSAGTGVTHSEFNGSRTEPVSLLQMWILPRDAGTEPRYEQRAFPVEERRGRLRLVVSPDGEDGALTIGQDARLFVGSLGSGDRTEHVLPSGRKAWIHVAEGRVRLNDSELAPGDGAAIEQESALVLECIDDAEVVLWDLPEA